ncbi:hypothetical protein CVT25_008805 [Psilocybe cyanescens]|uniref:DUF6535 domain-containing protein n=1 Tax=Psilocybe cyanescens TaxID=93625 RepID=A0A409XLC0_PSICY|nr:hypothetical protein CVT25_008805 [Psilocybe cyanescens]
MSFYQKTENDSEDISGNEQVNEPELPKIWKVGDPFQFAPPRPDGDPWTLLLEPLLKTDKARCDAWRDEVQNLLIFAGLFSAVVTTFIVESYKNLQPNPDDTVISLLSRIATHLESPLGSNSSLPSPVQPEFSPDSSSLRVNTLWFISLVLSLTTVLVGTISLQWLREHQSFSELTPREMYAVHHMRYQALISWHVDKIFNTLPLLLQCSLVLFLIGIIDFLHAMTIKNWIVTIPVAVVVGFTMLFLIATAMLPTLQALSLYFDFSSERSHPGGNRVPAPSPCPYKSPQSHAIRMLSHPLLHLLDRLYPSMRTLLHKARHRLKNPFSQVPLRPLSYECFTRYLFYASLDSKWTDYDVSWLAIRDGFMRRALGRSQLYETVGTGDDEVFPLHDIVRGLSTQNHQKHSAPAAYHCFAEISEMTLQPLHRSDYNYDSTESRCRQSAYLHDLISSTTGITCLSDIFDFDAAYRSQEGNAMVTKTLHDILHEDNTYLFLQNHFFGSAPLLSTHRKELSLRLSAYFYQETHVIQTSDQKVTFPSSLTFTPFEVLLLPDISRDEFNVIAWQVANITLSIMKQCVGDIHPDSLLCNAMAQKGGLPSYIIGAGYFTSHSGKIISPSQHQTETSLNDLERAIQEAFHTLFSFIETQLQNEISSWPTAEGSPSLLFYFASFYARCIRRSLQYNPFFISMHSTICKYKRRTIDMGIVDSILELNFQADQSNWNPYDEAPFSTEWWEYFKTSDTSNVAFNGRKSPSIVLFFPFETA